MKLGTLQLEGTMTKTTHTFPWPRLRLPPPWALAPVLPGQTGLRAAHAAGHQVPPLLPLRFPAQGTVTPQPLCWDFGPRMAKQGPWGQCWETPSLLLPVSPQLLGLGTAQGQTLA